MQLYGFDDTESQLLPLSNQLRSILVIASGDNETQPFWLRAVITPWLPDACKYLHLGVDATAWLHIAQDAIPSLWLNANAAAYIPIAETTVANFPIRPDASINLEADLGSNTPTAYTGVGIAMQAQAALFIQAQADGHITYSNEAIVTLPGAQDADVQLHISPDAEVFIDVEACHP